MKKIPKTTRNNVNVQGVFENSGVLHTVEDVKHFFRKIFSLYRSP